MLVKNHDFYWVNFTVRKDKKAAMMFDYNLLGRGYRFSDFRNVCSSMSIGAKLAFMDEYNQLSLEKHGHTRTEAENIEKCIDDLVAPLFTLIIVFIEKEEFPNWAEYAKNEVLNGNLLNKARQILL